MVYRFKPLDEHKLQLIDEGLLWSTYYGVFLTYNGNKKPFLKVSGKYDKPSTEYTHITDVDKVLNALRQQGVNRKKLRKAKFPDSIDKRVVSGLQDILDWLELNVVKCSC